jgi:hypothetical protein
LAFSSHAKDLVAKGRYRIVLEHVDIFQELLWGNCRTLLGNGWERDRNLGAPFKFGENHLREHIRKAVDSGRYIPPAEWPELRVEKKVCGDRDGHGAIDYFLVPKGVKGQLSLSDVLATCEVKGPTRPKLLEGSQKNWYPKVLADIEKQLWRARCAEAAQHFVCVFVQPRNGGSVTADFDAVLAGMLAKVPEACLGRTLWSQHPDVSGLHLATINVRSRV